MRSKAGGGPAVWFGGASAMSGWAANISSSYDWVNEQDDQRMKGAFNMGIVSGWVAKDVQSYAKYVANLDRSRETGVCLEWYPLSFLSRVVTLQTN